MKIGSKNDWINLFRYFFTDCIFLFWYSKGRIDGKENYGDLLSFFIVEKISKKRIITVKHPQKKIFSFFIKHYLAIGSIIRLCSKNSIVWGSGIIESNEKILKAKFLSVRGPRTRKRLLELGYEVPESYGDPGLLITDFVNNNVSKKYKLGIIPHYVDYDDIIRHYEDVEGIKVINLMTNDIIATTLEILECERIISSSLHGIIVSHAFGVEALWVRFSDKLGGDDVKFFDYFESVDINYNEVLNIDCYNFKRENYFELLDINNSVLLPKREVIEKRQVELRQSCPF